ncbi:MAG: PKD domain-containing protein [Gammaproteobacteria bacterium]|nr:PKD domain-containing protein [Gammaproteobacteria bacterium]
MKTTYSQNYQRNIFLTFSIFLLLLLSACAKPPGNDGELLSGESGEEQVDVVRAAVLTTNFVTRAQWRADRSRLIVSGNANAGDASVDVLNADSGLYVGTAVVDSRMQWRLSKTINQNTDVPCKVRAKSRSLEFSLVVAGAPANCSGAVVVSNSPPNGTILQPSTNLAINAGETVFFSGTASDPENDPVTYQWDFSNVAAVNNSQTPGNIRFNQAGTYTVTLSVRDIYGNVDPTPASRTITVNPVATNTPPNGIILSPAQDVVISAGGIVRLTASGVDPDGDAISYLWNMDGSRPNFNIQNPGDVVFNTPGVYHISLLVTDARGLADPTPALRMVTVESVPVNTPPNGRITQPTGNMAIYVGDTLSFSASATDAEGDAVTYYWNMDGSVPNRTTRSHSATFSQAGTYNITMTATDARGASDPTPAMITVSVLGIAQNLPPNGTITSPVSDVVITEGQSVNFSALGIDPDGNTPLAYHWNFGGGAPNAHVQNPGLITFPSAGVYEVNLVVTDSLGLADPQPATRLVTVEGVPVNRPPVGSIDQPTGNITIDVGDTVYFSGSATDPDGDAVTYFWDMNGVAPNTTTRVPGNISFQSPGVFTIRLITTDVHGLSDATPEQVVVTVNYPAVINVPPNSVISTPIGDVTINAGDWLNFSGYGFDPDNNTPLTYLWTFDGGASSSVQQNPGVVQFTTPGVFHVTFTVSDALGLSDASPATRVITVRDFQPANSPPNAVILSPASDMTIYEGDRVYFASYATDPEGNTPYVYSWNFNGARAGSALQNPGEVLFTTAGTYNIQLSVTDNLGASDPTPATRTITVVANVPVSVPPNGIINTPTGDLTITVGDRVNFTASGVDPDGNYPLSYRWSFDGAVPDILAQNPGQISFNQVGTYRVRLVVTDATGISDPVPAERLITVVGSATTNQAPTVSISQPLTNRTINVGDYVYFSATGADIDGHYPLTYHWSMAGVAPNAMGATPGNVQFNQAGTFNIRVWAVDALGLISQTYAERVITVIGSTTNTPPNGTIISPTADATIRAGSWLYFDGSGYDADQDALTYQWDFQGGVSTSINNTWATPGWGRFDVPGVYTITLTVTDSRGAVDSSPATRTVTVTY